MYMIPVNVGIVIRTFYRNDGSHKHNIKIKEKKNMPCDTITTVKLELKNANLTLLKKAIEVVLKDYAYVQTYGDGLKFAEGGIYNKSTGVLTVRNTKVGEQIKRAYSGEIVKAQASRFGWQVKETSEFKYQIIKR